MTGGNIGQGMLTGAISGAIFAGVGSIPGMENGGAFSPLEKAARHAGAGAASGGINAAITGGNVGVGMAIGAFSAGMGKLVGGGLPGRTLVGGVSGGIASEISGGDFGQGFVSGAGTSAIGSLANDWLHDKFLPWIKNHVGVSWTHSLLGVGTQTAIGGAERVSLTALDVAGVSLDVQVGDQPGKKDVVGEFGLGLGEHIGVGFYCFEAGSAGCTSGGVVFHFGAGLGSPAYVGGDYAK